MAKEKQTRRLIAMALAAGVATSAMPVTAFAETGVSDSSAPKTETSTSTDSEGNKTTTTTTTNADGSTKVESKTENKDGSSSESTTTTTGEGTTSAPKVTITVTSVKDVSGNETESSETTEKTYTDTQNNEDGGTTTTVKTETESETTENAPTQFVPKDDSTAGDDTTPPAEGDGTTGDDTTPPAEGDDTEPQKPTGNTDTGFVEGSTASGFVEGTTTDQTTTTEREETTTDTTVTDYKDRVVEESGSAEGSETTTTTETVVDKYIEDRDDQEEDSDTRTDKTGKVEVLENTPVPDEFPEGDVDTTETTTEITDADLPTSKDLEDYVDNITITLKPGDTDKEGSAAVDEEQLYQDLLAATRPQPSETKGETQTATEDVTDDAGNKIGTITIETTTDVKTDVEDVKNSDGKVVGYGTTTTTTTTVVKTTVVDDVEEYDPKVTTGETKTTVDNSETEPVVKLPDRPTESETKDAAGAVTKVTVEDIVDENNQIVGYLKKTVVTNTDGKEIATGSETFWGTYSKTVTTKETLETTNTRTDYITITTVDTEITQGRVVGGEWITSTAREATASMGKVTEGTTEDGVKHGYTQMSALQISDERLAELQGWANAGTHDLTRPDDVSEKVSLGGDEFEYVGHLAGSEYYIYKSTDGASNWSGHTSNYIYVLKDSAGNRFYGYCCDLATTAVGNHKYEIGNVEDEAYYQNREDNPVAHIRYIAMNGYWGTESGTGSLSSVQKVLKDYLKGKGYSEEAAAAEAATLTDGQALAATQAAMWKYGNNGDATPVWDDNITRRNDNTGANTSADINNEWEVPTNASIQADANIQHLYEALVAGKLGKETSTNVLDKNDITGSSITIGDKVNDHVNNTDTDTSNDVFNTSVSFTVALVPTANDNLEVIVYQGNREVGRKSVTADNASSKTDSSATYTLEGLQLQEGLEVNLSLEGTQNLKKGVYLYTATVGDVKDYNASQTFVGIAQGNRTVALDVNMSFDVTDETATRHSKSGSDSRKKSGSKTTTVVDTAIDEEVVAMMEVTSVTITEDGYEWNSEYNEEYSYSDGGGKDPDPEKPTEDPKDPTEPKDPTDPGDSNDDEKEDLLDIGEEGTPRDDMQLLDAEEEVPLVAGIPETGDNNHVMGFGAMALAALAGMFGLRKKENH